jgi:hypothetical protein
VTLPEGEGLADTGTQAAAVHPFRVMLLTPGRPKVAAKDLCRWVDALERSKHLLRRCPDDLQRHEG